jgi:hypothetical protein
LTSANESLTQQVETLSGKPSLTIAKEEIEHKVSQESFDLDGVEYVFKMPAVIFEGHKVTSDHVLANEQLQRRMVDKKCGMIARKPEA